MATEFEEIRQNEEANYQLSVKLLGDTVSLVDDLLEFYELLAKIGSASRLAARDEFVTSLHFLQAARYHLTIGALAALRAHITDALRSGRMAIEMAAFAARVKRQPDLALVWLKAADSPETYDRYWRIFSGQKMFPESEAVLRELGDRLDMTSKVSVGVEWVSTDSTFFPPVSSLDLCAV